MDVAFLHPEVLAGKRATNGRYVWELLRVSGYVLKAPALQNVIDVLHADVGKELGSLKVPANPITGPRA